MIEGNEPLLVWMRWLDAEPDRIPAVLEDHTGRLQWVDGRLTRLAAGFAVIETFDHEVVGIVQTLEEYGRRVARVDDVMALAESPSWRSDADIAYASSAITPHKHILFNILPAKHPWTLNLSQLTDLGQRQTALI